MNSHNGYAAPNEVVLKIQLSLRSVFDALHSMIFILTSILSHVQNVEAENGSLVILILL